MNRLFTIFFVIFYLNALNLFARSFGPRDFFEGLLFSHSAHFRQSDNYAYSIFYTTPKVRLTLMNDHNAKAKSLIETQKQKKSKVEDLAKELEEDKYKVIEEMPSWHNSVYPNVLVVPITNQTNLENPAYYYSNVLEIGGFENC